MKKSLIAVAALAAVGAASAQSSVTLYGVIDTGYGIEQTKSKFDVADGVDVLVGVDPAGDPVEVSGPLSAVYKKRSTGLKSGSLSGSRWGLKGQEDLGNGLSAVFNVEAGFNSANGSFNAGGFNRRAVVGLKGGFGQVLLGRDYTPMDSIGGDYQASDLVTGDGDVEVATDMRIGPVSATIKFGKEGGFYTSRADGIHYSGEFGGVGVKAFMAYNDTKTTLNMNGAEVMNTRSRQEGYGVGVSYAGGPFTVGAAVQQFRTKSGGLTTAKQTQYGVGATYDFNVAKLYAHYLANDDRDSKPMQQFGVGVTVPFGAFTLGAQYAYNYWKQPSGSAILVDTTDPSQKVVVPLNLGNEKAKGHDFVLQGTYALSKRTDVYARAARTGSWKINGNGWSAKTHTDSFAVGLRHRF